METQTLHNKYTLKTVFLYKFISWVDKSSMAHISTTLLKYAVLILAIAFVLIPSFIIGMLSAVFLSQQAASIIGLLGIFFYGKSIYKWGRKKGVKIKANNQHSWNGVPISELANYLIDNQKFTFDAKSDLHLAQKQWSKMARVLQDRGLLYKSAEHSNARILRPITREQLVRQLKDGFPLLWSEDKQDWIERDGSWRTWVWDQEKSEQRRRAENEKLEKKKKKLKKEIEEIKTSPVFTCRQVSLV